MTVQQRIQDLEAKGFGVEIIHTRNTVQGDPKRAPLPKGGTTLATIFDTAHGNVVSRHLAICHQNDNYNRRVGASIALGRAAKKAGLK